MRIVEKIRRHLMRKSTLFLNENLLYLKEQI